MNHEVEDLPEGWEAAWDEAHRQVYYYNRTTQQRTWHKPEDVGFFAETASRTATALGSVAVGAARGSDRRDVGESLDTSPKLNLDSIHLETTIDLSRFKFGAEELQAQAKRRECLLSTATELQLSVAKLLDRTRMLETPRQQCALHEMELSPGFEARYWHLLCCRVSQLW